MLRILIADDHELLRNGVRRLLESQSGWSVVAEAGTGNEAVRLAEETQPDVAILDLAMPEISGLSAATQLAERSPRTAVLIFTMHHSEQVTREVAAAGALGYVLKSDTAKDLVEAVRSVSEGRLAYPANSQSALAESGTLRRRRSPGELSPREVEILCRLASGQSNKEIAFQLNISLKTVETHRAHLMSKLKLNSICELVHYAVRHELINPWSQGAALTADAIAGKD